MRSARRPVDSDLISSRSLSKRQSDAARASHRVVALRIVPALLCALLAALPGCDDECAGARCGACASAITLRVDARDAEVEFVSGPTSSPLTCSSVAVSTICESHGTRTPGTYAYDVSVAGRTQRVSLVVEPSTGGCCDCGYTPAMVNVTFADDGGV